MNSTVQLLLQMAPPSQGGQQPNPFVSLIPLILIFVIFYFMLIRPQQKKAKEHQGMLGALKPGDEVITNGGIYGRITRVGDRTITVEVAEKVRIRVGKEYIAGKVTDAGDGAGTSESAS
ncbi:MAG: preprotein translocase subunit YajC [Bdellovibrionota bacterium]